MLPLYLFIVLFIFCCIFNQQVNYTVAGPSLVIKLYTVSLVSLLLTFPFQLCMQRKHAYPSASFLWLVHFTTLALPKLTICMLKAWRKSSSLQVIQSFAAKRCKLPMMKTHTRKCSSNDQSQPQSGLAKCCQILFSVFSFDINIPFCFTFYLPWHTSSLQLPALFLAALYMNSVLKARCASWVFPLLVCIYTQLRNPMFLRNQTAGTFESQNIIFRFRIHLHNFKWQWGALEVCNSFSETTCLSASVCWMT